MPPKKKLTNNPRRLFALRLNEELLTKLRHVALDLKRPANHLLEDVIKDWLMRYREGKWKPK